MPLVLLEHLNFKVEYANGERLIKEFFVNALGCPECPPGRLQVCRDEDKDDDDDANLLLPPGTDKQMHVNLGPLSQIHFELCTCVGEPYTVTQRLLGSVTLQMASLQRLRDGLRAINHPFKDEATGVVTFRDALNITNWICFEGEEEEQEKVPCYRAGGVGNVLRLAKVEFLLEGGDGNSSLGESIADFYAGAFGAHTSLATGGRHCVNTTMGQSVVFAGGERGSGGMAAKAYDTNKAKDGIHMCFYIDDFDRVARTLEQQFWVNPDYVGPPINDNCRTHEQALARRQFRIKHVGQRFVLEHEIRAVDHPLNPFGKIQRVAAGGKL